MRKFICAAMGVLAVVVAASCGGAGGGSTAQVATMLPAGDYIGIFGFHPAQIYNSGIFKKFTEESEVAQAQMMKGQFDNSAKEMGLKPDEIAGMTVFMSADMQDFLGVLDAAVTIEKLMEAEKENTGAEFEETEKDGTKIWTRKGSDWNLMEHSGVKLMGSMKGLEAVLAAENKLADDEKYKQASGLIDTGASIYGVYWGDISMVAGMGGAMLAKIDGGPEAAETLQKVTAAGGSIYFRDDFELKIKMAFGEGADVGKLADFFNSQKTALATMGAGSVGLMTPGPAPDPEKIVGLAEKLRFAASGNVLEIGIKLTYDDIMSMMPKPMEEESEDVEEY